MIHLKEMKEKLEGLKARRAEFMVASQSEPCTAIIIEPRKHRALSFVIQNVLENLPTNWNVRIYHGTENREFVESLLETVTAAAAAAAAATRERISLQNLGVADLPTARSYSEILLRKQFTEEIPTETFLVFQTDSMINPRNRHLLQKFMKYDYVGAPWRNGGVGNGGFSLRKRSKMLQILSTFIPNPPIAHEDLLFSVGSRIARPFKPSAEEAKQFSMETVYTEIFFGIHRAWVYHPGRIKEMCAVCPGLETLISLQGIAE